MGGGQEDTTGGLPLADDMAGSGRGQDAILADQELLDTVCRTNLGNDLDNLGIPESTITTNDKVGT